eukprot:5738052-Pleurochrysis_carterae.AAC.2
MKTYLDVDNVDRCGVTRGPVRIGVPRNVAGRAGEAQTDGPVVGAAYGSAEHADGVCDVGPSLSRAIKQSANEALVGR